MITKLFLLLIKHFKHFLIAKILLTFYNPHEITATQFIDYQTYSFNLHLDFKNPNFLRINYYSNNLHNNFNILRRCLQVNHMSMNLHLIHFL
jgi:hypothetical protein